MTIPDERASSTEDNATEERGESNIQVFSLLNGIYSKTNKFREAEELEAYLEEDVESAEQDIYMYWKIKSRVWPRLAKMARDYLAIPATSASSERIFSTCKDLTDISRYTLYPPTMECCVTLRSWLKSKIVKLNLPEDDFEEEFYLMQGEHNDIAYAVDGSECNNSLVPQMIDLEHD